MRRPPRPGSPPASRLACWAPPPPHRLPPPRPPPSRPLPRRHDHPLKRPGPQRTMGHHPPPRRAPQRSRRPGQAMLLHRRRQPMHPRPGHPPQPSGRNLHPLSRRSRGRQGRPGRCNPLLQGRTQPGRHRPVSHRNRRAPGGKGRRKPRHRRPPRTQVPTLRPGPRARDSRNRRQGGPMPTRRPLLRLLRPGSPPRKTGRRLPRHGPEAARPRLPGRCSFSKAARPELPTQALMFP